MTESDWPASLADFELEELDQYLRAHPGDARLLLEVLTPIAKSWPSEWCLEANSLAIQVHGGYGYTRDFPVEQYWRDNRLNMIHEGTEAIHGIDLLGRKVPANRRAGFDLLLREIRALTETLDADKTLSVLARQLGDAVQAVEDCTSSLLTARFNTFPLPLCPNPAAPASL